MPVVQLPAGPIEYTDTGGTGPVVVLLHGLAMDGTGWRKVVPRLQDGYRCIMPTLPLGAHRQPMRAHADLSMTGMVKLVADFLAALDLHAVTLVGSDWGGAQLLITHGHAQRISRLVLCPCEAFDNYPPMGLSRSMAVIARIPGGLRLAFAPLRSRRLRRLPMLWGGLAKHGIPDEITDAWFTPLLTRKEIRRDVRKYVTSAPNRQTLLDWARKQAEFTGPVLVVWATRDRLMPPAHGRRLAELFPNARLVEIEDSYTLVQEDQPERLTEALRGFLAETDQKARR